MCLNSPSSKDKERLSTITSGLVLMTNKNFNSGDGSHKAKRRQRKSIFGFSQTPMMTLDSALCKNRPFEAESLTNFNENDSDMQKGRVDG